MKTIKSTGTIAAMLILFVFIFQGCAEHKDPDAPIPYNNENAKRHFISLRDAVKFTTNFKRGKIELTRQLKDPTYLEKHFIIPNAELFNKDALIALLSQKGAKGVRIYLGKDERDSIRMILAAVDARGNDITGRRRTSATRMQSFQSDEENLTTSALLLEAGQRCPTLCDYASPLNFQVPSHQ